jgi:uncharacterized protein (TIGR03083 family)
VTDAPRWIAALRRSHDDLVAFTGDLTGEQLRGPSGCSNWTLAQVLSHLGSGAEIGLTTLEANLAGLEPPGSDANQAVWDRWNAMTPEQQAAEFVSRNEAFVRAWEGADERPITLPFLPEPITLAEAAGFRLSEHVVHSWDVRVGLDDGATLPADAAGLLAQRLELMAGWLGQADRWSGGPQVVRVDTTDPADAYTLEVGAAVSFADGAPAAAATTLTLPTEALLRLVYGRLPARWTPASATIEGPLTLDDLRAVFPGF